MTLSAPAVKAEILLKMAAEFGPSDDAAKNQKFAQAMADAILVILINQMVVTTIVPAGSSAGTYVAAVT